MNAHSDVMTQREHVRLLAGQRSLLSTIEDHHFSRFQGPGKSSPCLTSPLDNDQSKSVRKRSRRMEFEFFFVLENRISRFAWSRGARKNNRAKLQVKTAAAWSKHDNVTNLSVARHVVSRATGASDLDRVFAPSASAAAAILIRTDKPCPGQQFDV